jgi:hypothetical protein
MICKVCGNEGPQTIGGICSEECVDKLREKDKIKFKDELFQLCKKYANSPYYLDSHKIIKDTVMETLDDLAMVW